MELNYKKFEDAAQEDRILNEFKKLDFVKDLLSRYREAPQKELSEQILNLLRVYYNYVMFLAYAKKAMRFRSCRLKANENKRQSKLKYDLSFIDPYTSVSDGYNLDWEFLIQSPELLNSIQSLNVTQKKVLTYIYIHGANQRQAAEALVVSPQAVQKVHRNSVSKIRKSMQRNLVDV